MVNMWSHRYMETACGCVNWVSGLQFTVPHSLCLSSENYIMSCLSDHAGCASCRALACNPILGHFAAGRPEIFASFQFVDCREKLISRAVPDYRALEGKS